MANPPFDPYGNPVPSNPGAKRVTNSSGTTYPIRTNLALANILVTDSPETDTTTITGSAAASNVNDLRNYAVSRAITLLGLTNPTVVIDEPFAKAPGTSPSFFPAAGGGGTSAQRTDRSGGWTTIASTASAGTDRSINAGGACIVSNVGQTKWYQLWLFSIDTTVESGTFMEIGWIDTGVSANQPKIGAIGSGSTTKFRAFDNTSGVNSSVNLDTGIHIGEHWCDGAGNIYMSIDGETAVTYATAKTAACQPIAQVSNGSTAAVRSVSIGHLVVVTPRS